MAAQFLKFPSINQFRHVIKHVVTSSDYVGKENGESIYDSTRPKPKIEFTGTIKLHGTNGAVGWNGNELWTQKRTGLCSIEKDNAGFAFFVKSHEEQFKKLFKVFCEYDRVFLFGEWCGAGVQKGVALNELEKMFVIVDICIQKDGEKLWFNNDQLRSFAVAYDVFNPIFKKQNRIYSIFDFPFHTHTIDFEQPALSQNYFSDLTIKVEEECPVAKHFGVSGVGEGIVWRALYNNEVLRFKVKGEKHSSSKVKTLASVDLELIKGINEFVDYAVTENRLEQAWKEVFNDAEPSISKTGTFLRWMVSDIIKEEIDVMANSGLEPKFVNKYISEKSKKWFFDKLQNV